MSVVTRLLDRLALPALLAIAGLSMADRPVCCAQALLERAARVVASRPAAVAVVDDAPVRVAVVRQVRVTRVPRPAGRIVPGASPRPERSPVALRG